MNFHKLSTVIKSVQRYICAPPCPTLCGWSLFVTSAS